MVHFPLGFTFMRLGIIFWRINVMWHQFYKRMGIFISQTSYIATTKLNGQF